MKFRQKFIYVFLAFCGGFCAFADAFIDDNGKAAWLALDSMATPPDVVLEEGAFVTLWGGDANFMHEARWKNQVDTLAAISNSKVLFMSHVNTGNVNGSCSSVENPGASGTLIPLGTVTFWDALWYAMSSYLLGKNDIADNSYFMMRYTTGYRAFDL